MLRLTVVIGWGCAVLVGAGLGACGKSAGAGGSASAAPAAAVAVNVPLVGCPDDGQQGPNPPPANGTKSIVADPAAAAQLAYYVAADTPGVLAPRGWHCAGVYGSNGATLVVAPGPFQASDIAANQSWAGASGDAIEARVASGETSGRFEVAHVAARVFPAHQAFVQGVIGEGIEPASSFPSGAYAGDKITAKGGEVVEFQTPANAVGLGTDANLNERLTPGADPVSGAAILVGDAPDLALAAVRLPAGLRALAPTIVAQFEADNPAGAAGGSSSAGPAPQTGNGDGQAGSPTAGGNPNALAVVQDFYDALGRGDGAAAANDIVPEKRVGNYSPAALTRYYGAMAAPLQLASANVTGDVVAVRYRFATAGGRVCDGAANVVTTTRGGATLIARIEALNGC